MRRIALALTLLGLAAASVVAAASADDSRTYTIELDNAFGIVDGSEIRIAGVTQGTVTDLDVNDAKRAVVTAELNGPVSELGEDTVCSSEPQSLIAEYFIDCDSRGAPLEPQGSVADPDIPVAQTRQTVQQDLVQNMLREPFNRRLQLIINEFGTALAGNPEALNAAIRRGAPALRNLRTVLRILGDHNRTIRSLVADSDQIMARLADRRDDVVGFVQEAGDTAAASADRREDLSRDFEILDDALAELEPTMADLGELAREQTPLLADLRAAGPGLNRLALNLPEFGDSATVSLQTLGRTSVVGRRALRAGRDDIRRLRRASRDAPGTATPLAAFARDIDDPRRAVEIDRRAGTDTGRTGTRPGRRNTMGYTGLEGLLNYLYYQTGSINQFDQVGHMLRVGIWEEVAGPCSDQLTGGKPGDPDFGVPSIDGGRTTNILEAHPCVSWLGPNQPRLSEPMELPPYDPSVCDEGSNAPDLCDPGTAATTGSVAGRKRSDEARGKNGNGGGSAAQDLGAFLFED
jgi:ABC-type transporter Mla subunit MlaD